MSGSANSSKRSSGVSSSTCQLDEVSPSSIGAAIDGTMRTRAIKSNRFIFGVEIERISEVKESLVKICESSERVRETYQGEEITA